MAAMKKKEVVSASFHYLVRAPNNSSEPTTPFSGSDLDLIEQKMLGQKQPDLKDKKTVDRLRFGNDLIIFNVTRLNSTTLAGTFKNAYSGHAFENTHRGKIPAESVSLRPFHFLLYLSKSGRLYIAAQYLGLYGGYGSLQFAIKDMLSAYTDVQARTYRLEAQNLAKAEAREVRVTLAKKSDNIAAENIFQRSSVITFKKSSREDGFEKAVSTKLLSVFGRPIKEIKKAVADILNENELLDVNDDDIQDCTIVAKMNGGQKTIYLMDAGSFATRFPLDVPLDSDGHPKFEETKLKLIELLKSEIIAKSENA